MKMNEIFEICNENNYQLKINSQYQTLCKKDYSRNQLIDAKKDFKDLYDIQIQDEDKKYFSIEISCEIRNNELDYIISISIYYSELEDSFYNSDFLNLLSKIRYCDSQQNIEFIQDENHDILNL